MKETTEKTIGDKVATLYAQDQKNGRLCLDIIKVDRVKKEKGFIALSDCIKYKDVDVTGVNIKTLLTKLMKLCYFNRYHDEKHASLQFEQKGLEAFFESNDNAALIELTKPIVKEIKQVKTSIDLRKEEIEKQLNTGIITFVYQKKDQSIRTAKGTINIDLIPEEVRGSRIKNDVNIHYYDIIKQEFRSFNPLLFIGCTIFEPKEFIKS
jgi:hypothetical protein